MSTEPHRITVGGLRIDVVRKPIKNLHMGVYPPNGRIRVAAPVTVSDDAVRLAVVSRMGWIKRQQAKFEAQARQSQRAYVSGESHFFLGRRYRLEVVPHDGAPRVSFRNTTTLDLHVRESSETVEREKALQNWYRRELRGIAPPLIEKWAQSVQIPTPQWGIKRMKTKWGSCNIEARRIWLNLELIKKPPHCIEYVIVHEMIHFLERHHNDRFVALMDNHLPRWTHIREELNAEPLGHDNWP
jgi:predicted metal-dependent hydrolase